MMGASEESDKSTRPWYYPWHSAREHFVTTAPLCLWIVATQIFMWYGEIAVHISGAMYIAPIAISIWATYLIIMMLMNRKPLERLFRATRHFRQSK